MRTLVTILAIGVSLILIFASLTMFMNMVDPIDRNYEEYETWDVKALLAERMGTTDVMEALDDPELAGLRAEPMLDDYLPVEHEGKLKFIHIQAFLKDTTLRNYNIIEGKEDFENQGILVGSLVASELDIIPGDVVPFKVGSYELNLTVSGITGELMDDSIFMTLEMVQGFVALATLAGALGPDSPLSVYANATNAVIVDIGGMSEEAFEDLLGQHFPVTSYLYSSDVKEGIMSLLESLIFVFFIFIGFGILAEVLFISTTIVLNILDRESEFVSLRTMGGSPRRIKLMVVVENLLLFGAGVVVGIPLSILATRWAIWYTTKDLMYLDIRAGPEVYVITILIAFLSTVIASYISARHITKLRIADIIRQKLTDSE